MSRLQTLKRGLLGPWSSARRNIVSNSQISPFKQQSNTNRDLILSILNLTTTRRETNNYLNKYSSSLLNDKSSSNKKEINDVVPLDAPFRLLFVKIRGNLYNLEQDKLKKLQTTLSYLIKLGNLPVIVLDSSEILEHQLLHQKDSKLLNYRGIDNYLFDQFNALATLWNDEIDVLPVRSSLSTYREEEEKGGGLKIKLDEYESILVKERALEKSVVPVIYPYVFDTQNGVNLLCDSSEFMNYLIDNLLKINDIKQKEVLSLEKIIFIDELGGIPSIERLNNSHVFINLNQEYDEILAELHVGRLPDLKEREIHTKNLKDMELLLDSNSTGLITTLDIAIENLKLNPIIYNVLTDRSLISSSLSMNKISNDDIHHRITKTTVLKKGLSVNIYNSLDSVDLVKLKTLIDDSFKRTLNMEHYLNRVSGNINKIIIVGDYDGCAIVTNETSITTGLKFPYLDKFAVSRRAQGSLGVADMIFNILLKQISKKDTLLWRSKKKNPVNGWYFQRSTGTLALDESSEFRLFWNGQNGKFNKENLKAFIEITKNIEPSFE